MRPCSTQLPLERDGVLKVGGQGVGNRIRGAVQEPLCLAYQSVQLAGRAPSLAALDSLAVSRWPRQDSFENACTARDDTSSSYGCP